MRTAIVFALAAALAAAPAAAQNDTNATVDANTTMAMPADNGAAASNDMNALPPEPVATDTATEPAAPEPAPAPRRGFPWGVIGLVGLVGLMGRKRRD
jgi:hypothetical protein